MAPMFAATLAAAVVCATGFQSTGTNHVVRAPRRKPCAPRTAPVARRTTRGPRRKIPVVATGVSAPNEEREERTKLLARVGVLGCACVYGTNFASIKTLDHELAPALAASLRFGLAAVASLPILMKYQVKTLAAGSPERALVIGAGQVGFVNSIGYIAQSVGLQSVDASLSAFVCSLAVVVVPILDAVVLKKQTKASTWAGAALAALGVALLSFGDGGGDHAAAVVAAVAPAGPFAALAANPQFGLVATAVQPICFGFGFWRTEQLLSSKTATIAPLACAATQLTAVKAAADVWLLIVWCTNRESLPADGGKFFEELQKPNVLAAVLWTGLFTTFATVLIETVALSRISARESTLLFATEPLWGAAFAAATLGEHLSNLALAGGVCVLLACLAPAWVPEGQPIEDF
ncbi:hypothetical protein M885DRAFT_512192 [Pelagophyceae sp. CCMP2097]|nr:hypothetical protein M885DRAFT_512192 [Pelagophyceae sp. CCMP2097]